MCFKMPVRATAVEGWALSEFWLHQVVKPWLWPLIIACLLLGIFSTSSH